MLYEDPIAEILNKIRESAKDNPDLKYVFSPSVAAPIREFTGQGHYTFEGKYYKDASNEDSASIAFIIEAGIHPDIEGSLSETVIPARLKKATDLLDARNISYHVIKPDNNNRGPMVVIPVTQLSLTEKLRSILKEKVLPQTNSVSQKLSATLDETIANITALDKDDQMKVLKVLATKTAAAISACGLGQATTSQLLKDAGLESTLERAAGGGSGLIGRT